jgi:glycosyltransferase involved in cell wall biosynthesis
LAPEFSVVIPTHGRPDYLNAALRSVFAQTFTDFECIVVDDASPEPPDLPSDARVRLVRRHDNGGPAAARNSGIDVATGKYVAFLDDDDLWLSDRLLHARAAHARAPIAVCWQSTLNADAGNPSGRILEGNVGDVILDDITPHLGATSIERNVVVRFDERYDTCEDVDWWLRATRRLPVATTQAVGLTYRSHSGARVKTGMVSRLAGAQMLLDEHAGWFDTHRRAKAFRLKRMGLSALALGDRRLALRCFAGSFRLQPQPRTAWHALRTLSRPPPAAERTYGPTPSERE